MAKSRVSDAYRSGLSTITTNRLHPLASHGVIAKLKRVQLPLDGLNLYNKRMGATEAVRKFALGTLVIGSPRASGTQISGRHRHYVGRVGQGSVARMPFAVSNAGRHTY